MGVITPSSTTYAVHSPECSRTLHRHLRSWLRRTDPSIRISNSISMSKAAWIPFSATAQNCNLNVGSIPHTAPISCPTSPVDDFARVSFPKRKRFGSAEGAPASKVMWPTTVQAGPSGQDAHLWELHVSAPLPPIPRGRPR